MFLWVHTESVWCTQKPAWTTKKELVGKIYRKLSNRVFIHFFGWLTLLLVLHQNPNILPIFDSLSFHRKQSLSSTKGNSNTRNGPKQNWQTTCCDRWSSVKGPSSTPQSLFGRSAPSICFRLILVCFGTYLLFQFVLCNLFLPKQHKNDSHTWTPLKLPTRTGIW